MEPLPYLWFKLGRCAEVEAVPAWVREATDLSSKMESPANGSVEAVFTGDSVEYRVRTKRTRRGAGSNKSTLGSKTGL